MLNTRPPPNILSHSPRYTSPYVRPVRLLRPQNNVKYVYQQLAYVPTSNSQVSYVTQPEGNPPGTFVTQQEGNTPVTYVCYTPPPRPPVSQVPTYRRFLNQ